MPKGITFSETQKGNLREKQTLLTLDSSEKNSVKSYYSKKAPHGFPPARAEYSPISQPWTLCAATQSQRES